MKDKKLTKPIIIEHPIYSQGIILEITMRTWKDLNTYGRLIPELIKRDIEFKRPDLVKILIFKYFKEVHVQKNKKL